MSYRKDLDVLKGIAIIAVVFYHLGILKSGYLGVDLFFVINGFLVIPSVIKQLSSGEFSYFQFLKKRVERLLPLIVVAMTVCLGVGYWGMLPDDYENLSQYVVASGLLSGNIMSSISAANYWDVLNDFKPLMHMWYVGILFEFYIVFPFIAWLFSKLFQAMRWDFGKAMNVLLVCLTVVSLALYLNPDTPTQYKFYYLPYRFFEITLGGIIALNISKLQLAVKGGGSISLILLVLCIFSGLFTFDIHNIGNAENIIGISSPATNSLILPGWILLLMTVTFSGLVLTCKESGRGLGNMVLNLSWLAYVGKMSFSIFVWHQIIVAFYRYFISTEITISFLLGYLIIVGSISWLSYQFIEQKIKVTNKSLIVTIIADAFIVMAGLYIYLIAGVVRDVPELDTFTSNRHRGMHAEYCDQVRQYNKDFPEENGRINVLVIGNSFGRDMANVLLESDYKDSINLSYCDFWDLMIERVNKSDVVFCFRAKNMVPQEIWDNLKERARVYGIGTKNYGKTNGCFYKNRHKEDYFMQRVEVSDGYLGANEYLHKTWGEDYVDFMSPILQDKTLPVFTPDRKYISPDNKHLSKAGARYYSQILDIGTLLFQ